MVGDRETPVSLVAQPGRIGMQKMVDGVRGVEEVTAMNDAVERLWARYLKGETDITHSDLNALAQEVAFEAWNSGHSHCFHVESPKNEGNPHA